jgi:Na+/pantothenate symporter
MAKYGVYSNPVNNHEVRIKKSFSWATFLFGPVWYLLNGMIGKGLGWCLLALISAPTVVGPFIVWFIAGKKASIAKETLYLEKGYIFKGDE